MQLCTGKAPQNLLFILTRLGSKAPQGQNSKPELARPGFRSRPAGNTGPAAGRCLGHVKGPHTTMVVTASPQLSSAHWHLAALGSASLADYSCLQGRQFEAKGQARVSKVDINRCVLFMSKGAIGNEHLIKNHTQDRHGFKHGSSLYPNNPIQF